jgi:CRISPR-associated endonuclease/helicase Cas3
LNTIKTSKEVYHRIAKRLGETAVRLGSQDENTGLQDPTKIVLAYLSTSIVANERKRRVNQIAECLRKNRIVILVSTQVVEAGVDLDFDAAFRDIGPLDAIIQVAGRCNRNWLKERGKVHIVRIVDESGKEDSKKIYGQILPNRATEWLGTYQEIDEEDLYGLLSEYYKDILYRMNIEDYPDSADFLKAIKNLDFSKLSHFSLIREEPKIPLFIELNEEAKRLHSEFKKLLEILGKLTEPKEIFEQKALIRKTAAEMENYTVRVYNDRSLPKLESIKEGIEVKYIPHEMVDIFYDGETGFKS